MSTANRKRHAGKFRLVRHKPDPYTFYPFFVRQPSCARFIVSSMRPSREYSDVAAGLKRRLGITSTDLGYEATKAFLLTCSDMQTGLRELVSTRSFKRRHG
jgi:hypothetical protein